MPKKGKKSSQKRGKTSGKSAKKHTASQTGARQPSTNQDRKALPSDSARPSTSSHNAQAISSDMKKPSGIIVKKCEEIEKLAASIQKRCKLSPHANVQSRADDPPENVQELEFLVSEIKKLARNVGFDLGTQPSVSSNPNDQKSIKWSKTKMRVPHIFIHRPLDKLKQVRETVMARNIQMYFPETVCHHMKVLCPTFEDHEKFVTVLEELQIPYHTFGHPSKRVIKVVIRGLSNDVVLNDVKEALNAASIPVVRINEMNAKVARKAKYKSILAVVPGNDEGRKVFHLRTILGQTVKVETPMIKSKQCHRCQKWGHSQVHCHGLVKCVKCAGDHYSSECGRDPETEPLKCANCEGEHTANYRRCPQCPDSKEYQEGLKKKNRSKPPRMLMKHGNDSSASERT